MDEQHHADSEDLREPLDTSPRGTSGSATSEATEEKGETWLDTVKFIVSLVLIVIVLRSFIFSPFNIPSQSMLPRLLIGDYLFVSKWNYGYSKYSLPFNLPLIPKMHWADPQPGDVVVFKAPPRNNEDWIKRVIGLPGDTIQMHGGQLILDGKPVPKQRVADFTVPITPNFSAVTAENPNGQCRPEFQATDAANKPICKIPQYRETLPNGRSYEVLDMGLTQADDTDVYTVPAGHVFLMGDNRDDSLDSRFSTSVGGISYVPVENVEGKAVVSFWSTDGSANWFLPWTWFTAARFSRIGHGF